MRLIESNMEERNWAELKKDCLVEILVRVGIETLAESIPFVCKSWYHATLDPGCWTTLDFPEKLCSDDFVGFVVGRSQRSATSVMFHPSCLMSEHALLCISEGCPLLKILYLPCAILKKDDLTISGLMKDLHMSVSTGVNDSLISSLIGKWKSLEYLKIWNCICLHKILEATSIHCKDFVGLDCSGTCDIKAASLILEFTPKIKYLRMRSDDLPRTCLLMLLKGCSELELLDVSNCIGFEEDDEEILKLASHINNFNCSGAKLYDEDDDYVYCDTYRDSLLFDDEYYSD